MFSCPGQELRHANSAIDALNASLYSVGYRGVAYVDSYEPGPRRCLCCQSGFALGGTYILLLHSEPVMPIKSASEQGEFVSSAAVEGMYACSEGSLTTSTGLLA